MLIRNKYNPVWADQDASYIKELEYDLDTLTPVIAKPHNVDNVVEISEAEGIAIDQFLLGTCTSGRVSDFEIAASILKGKKVAKDSRLLISPASRQILIDIISSGSYENTYRCWRNNAPARLWALSGSSSGCAFTGRKMSLHLTEKF